MVKSILKSTTSSTEANTPSRLESFSEARHRDSALFHATLLQQRKDAESLILASIETLLDFPPSPNNDPAHPLPTHIHQARQLLAPFQPSDYDSLIAERNIEEKCGYILCSRSRRREDTNARYRILCTNSDDGRFLKFVERQSLERWCSDECGRRALFIRVHLSDEPVWTRTTDASRELAFLEDSKSPQASEEEVPLVQGFHKLSLRLEEPKKTAAMNGVAIERGDRVIDDQGDSMDSCRRTLAVSKPACESNPNLKYIP